MMCTRFLWLFTMPLNSNQLVDGVVGWLVGSMIFPVRFSHYACVRGMMWYGERPKCNRFSFEFVINVKPRCDGSVSEKGRERHREQTNKRGTRFQKAMIRLFGINTNKWVINSNRVAVNLPLPCTQPTQIIFIHTKLQFQTIIKCNLDGNK